MKRKEIIFVSFSFLFTFHQYSTFFILRRSQCRLSVIVARALPNEMANVFAYELCK